MRPFVLLILLVCYFMERKPVSIWKGSHAMLILQGWPTIHCLSDTVTISRAVFIHAGLVSAQPCLLWTFLCLKWQGTLVSSLSVLGLLSAVLRGEYWVVVLHPRGYIWFGSIWGCSGHAAVQSESSCVSIPTLLPSIYEPVWDCVCVSRVKFLSCVSVLLTGHWPINNIYG